MLHKGYTKSLLHSLHMLHDAIESQHFKILSQKPTCLFSWTSVVNHECIFQELFFQTQSLMAIALLKWFPTKLSHAKETQSYLPSMKIIVIRFFNVSNIRIRCHDCD
jgi:hypothetical protein